MRCETASPRIALLLLSSTNAMGFGLTSGEKDQQALGALDFAVGR